MTERITTQPKDFLGRMVAKAQGAVCAIEPRLPSLFEPVGGAVVAAAVPLPADLQPGTADEPRPADISRMDVGDSHDEAEQTDNSYRGWARGKPPDTVASPPQSPLAWNGGEPLARSDSDRAAMTDAEYPGESGMTQRRRADVVSTDTLARMRPARSAAGIPLTRDVERVPARSGASSRDSSEPVDRAQQPKAGTLMVEPEAALVPRLAIAGAPKPASPPNRVAVAAGPMSEPQTPVINVTIGRVEIRAVQGALARPRADHAKPKTLSLDDYLKQRGGGR
ncbi:MAG: hypothetical protein WBX11_14705 [Thiobacillaceae bacterium]